MAQRGIRATSFVMVPVLFWVAACSKPLVLFLLTDKWAPCIPFLTLFCFLRICGCLSSIDKQVYYALGRSEIGMYYELLFLIANILLLFFTVRIGIMAVAIGYLVLEYIGTLVLFIVSSTIYNYSLYDRLKDIGLPFLNSAVMFLLCRSVSFFHFNNLLTLIVQLMVGMASYWVMAKLTKDISLPYILELFDNTIRKK